MVVGDISDMDECLGEVSNDCSAAADCINTVGSYSCHCKPGYGGDGTNCSDVDECSVRSHDCSKNAECLNIEGGYNCQCSIGYTGNGRICEALPDVREPEEQKTSENGSNLGLISGVTAAGFLVVATLLIIGFLCALKIRKHSKSMKVPLSINVAFGNEDCNTGRAKPDAITTSSNEAYHLVTHSARAEPSINTSSNEAYNLVNLTTRTESKAITTISNEAYDIVTPSARAESVRVTTSSNEAYNVVNLTTESTAITTNSNEAYNLVTPNTRAESDTITTNSNEAYPRMTHASRAEYDYVTTNKCFTNPFFY
ncbi:Pro-epidermal growth factor [Geodia barretti]|uniref:Pro-epidermal growth factor n=1 Tax=Geodia barretti TaxID=519541 RepID=A0AA35QV67_GEOBA|nr:Pro-epidermal growth factor [Geodia barretti]